ncbi:MAG: zinc-dependent alcohol dehydrogenase family protein [Amaricoccus sp.]
MRAAVLRSYNADLAIETVPDPVCEPDGVVLKVLACGICRSDWHGWTGEHPRVKPGQIPGHEYCGEVVEAGPRSGWQLGDRLVAPFILACGHCPACQSGNQNTCPDQRLPGFAEPGAFAEHIAVPLAHNLAPLPGRLAPTVAAALGCRATTAWHALTGRADLKAGEWLAIHGTGGVGLSAMLIGKALGARVVVVDIVPEKLAHALALGADAAVDARHTDAAAAIRDITGGGAQVSVEALGIAATTNASIECLAPLGRHVQVGMPVGHTARMDVNMNAVYMKNLALFGTRGMPSWRYPSLLALIEQGAVDFAPLIAREVALGDASAELRAFNGPTPPGVAVITDFAH